VSIGHSTKEGAECLARQLGDANDGKAIRGAGEGLNMPQWGVWIALPLTTQMKEGHDVERLVKEEWSKVRTYKLVVCRSAVDLIL
jgi:hypothetical protein